MCQGLVSCTSSTLLNKLCSVAPAKLIYYDNSFNFIFVKSTSLILFKAEVVTAIANDIFAYSTCQYMSVKYSCDTLKRGCPSSKCPLIQPVEEFSFFSSGSALPTFIARSSPGSPPSLSSRQTEATAQSAEPSTSSRPTESQEIL